MTGQQIELIRDSWSKVAPIATTAGTMFYERLFARAPQVRPMFAADITEQRRKLVEMLDRIVASLDRPAQLQGDLEALGRRHAGYGVAPAHYDAVAESLLWTLSQALGEGFTEQCRHAWEQALTHVAGVMIAAGR